MERQREKPEEIAKEKADQELLELRKELAKLKELKKAREANNANIAQPEAVKEQGLETVIKPFDFEDIESRLDKIENFLTSRLTEIDQKTYQQNAEEIEKELQIIEKEITGEQGVIAKEVTTYELLLEDYPWLEEKRYIFMYSIPNEKTNLSDYNSWRQEWSKIMFDYARYAILHILYLRKLETEKPFSNFEDRSTALLNIAQELVDRKQAEWLTKSKEKLRIYWKTLDNWAEEIYQWAMEISPLEPILIFEIRESDREFSNLPETDIKKIFKILEKNRRGKIVKMDNGDISFKLKIE